jgi:hypothetical protein
MVARREKNIARRATIVARRAIFFNIPTFVGFVTSAKIVQTERKSKFSFAFFRGAA